MSFLDASQAAREGDLDRVRELLAADPALPDACDARGSLLHAAVIGNQPAMAAFLITQNVDPAVGDADGETPLHSAARAGLKDVAAALLDGGAAVDARNAFGGTPLQWAARQEQAALVGLLLDHAADPNAANSSGRTPLHRAVEAGSVEIARLLLARGAAVDSRDSNGETPLHYAGWSGPRRGWWKTLLAGRRGRSMRCPGNALNAAAFMPHAGGQLEVRGAPHQRGAPAVSAAQRLRFRPPMPLCLLARACWR